MARRNTAEVYQREDGKYDWRLFSSNGRIVATSGTQGYNSQTRALEMLEDVLDGKYSECDIYIESEEDSPEGEK